MDRQAARIYRLEGFEIDTSQVCLRVDGQERHLRNKTFQVLIYLLEQRQRLVSKDELIDRVWQGMAVTDNTLEQSMAEIRRVLSDNSRKPRFIKTVPRSGYRFIAEVEEVLPIESIPRAAVTAASNETSISDISAKEVTLPSTQHLRRTPLRWVLILSAIILIGAVATAFNFVHRRFKASSLVNLTLPQSPGKRPVAVMFFDNRSGVADLDWLREGLADMVITNLSRANDLTVLSREQLYLLLERVGHNPREPIRLDEALNVARSSGAKIVILGSFARLDEQMRIDVQLHDARDGQLLAAERLVVKQPMEILTQVDLLSLKLASILGVKSAGSDSASLSSVMTNNLEAYRYYSLAVEKVQGIQNAEAVLLLKKSISLDPEFAMAYARLGYAYGVSGVKVEEAKPFLQKSFQLSQRLTEKDRLYIAAWYGIVNLDYSAAINSFRQVILHYPLEVEAFWRLARLLQGEKRYAEALEIAKQGLIIDAGAKDLYNVLGSIYSDLGRHDEAIAMFRRYVELAPDEPNAYDSLALGFQWAGRYSEGIEEYERALALKRDFALASIHLGNTYFQQGRYREAIRQYQHFIKVAGLDNDPGRAWHSLAVLFCRMRKFVEAERAAREVARQHQGVVNDQLLVALERGNLAAAEKLRETVENSALADRGTRHSQRQLLFLRGYLYLKTGRAAEAIENFKLALKERPLIWDIDPLEDCLANAYLELGKFDEAIAEYERILRLNPKYPLVHYRLAQAYERKGTPNQARAEYERFLQVWKDADGDIPEVIAARRILVEDLSSKAARRKQ